MDAHTPRSGFSDVDRQDATSGHIRLLDTLTSMPFYQTYKRRTFELLAPRPGEAILDVRCGTGDDSRELARLVAPGGRVIGLDTSETMLAEARRRGEGQDLPVEFVLADVQALPFDDGLFDACRADRTMQHVAAPRHALAEMVRATRPGGRLVVVDPDHDTQVLDVPDPYHEPMRRFLAFRAGTIRQGGIAHAMPALFREAGLRDVTVTPLTRITPSLAEANATSGIEGGIRIAAEHGALTEAEADGLIETLRVADAAGSYFQAVTFFITAGRKP